MKDNYDFKKEWERTKKQLVKLGKEATELAHKGEKEIIKISKKGKLHIDKTALNLKKERLYYSIGKEYVGLKDANRPTAKLKKLVEDLKKTVKEERALARKLKTKK